MPDARAASSPRVSSAAAVPRRVSSQGGLPDELGSEPQRTGTALAASAAGSEKKRNCSQPKEKHGRRGGEKTNSCRAGETGETGWRRVMRNKRRSNRTVFCGAHCVTLLLFCPSGPPPFHMVGHYRNQSLLLSTLVLSRPPTHSLFSYNLVYFRYAR